MDEIQAITILIQGIERGQKAGAYLIEEAYSLAVARDVVTKLAEKLKKEKEESALKKEAEQIKPVLEKTE